MENKSYYLIRVGEGSKYIDEARRKGFVAVGWDEVPDLGQSGSLEKIKKILEKSGELSKSQVAREGIFGCP